MVEFHKAIKRERIYLPMPSNKSTFSTDKEIKALKPNEKKYTCSDRLVRGLQLIIRVDGGKQFAFRYSSPTIKDKNNLSLRRQTGFGSYPSITLDMARKKVNAMKELILQGIDPLEQKFHAKEQITMDDVSQFHKVVYQWLNEVILKNNTTTTYNKIKRNFERDVFPYLCKFDANHNIVSSLLIGEITHVDILHIVKEKSITTAETAKRILANCNRIWIFAISHGYCHSNIIANISAKDSLPKTQKKHYPKITDEKVLGKLLLDIDSYKGNKIIRLSLQLLPYVMLRAENLCSLRWEQIDFEKKLLTIPRNKMKVKDKNLNDFIMPLTNKAIEILHETHRLTSWSPLVFHSVVNINKPINPTSINKALRLMGYNDEHAGTKQTIHSFRGTFRSLIETYANEHKATFEVKESILDHLIGSSVERAYTHKANYTNQARELLEWWERFLENLKKVENDN